MKNIKKDVISCKINKIELSEENTNPNKLFAKFIICPVDEGNLNKVGIKKDKANLYLNTLIGQPIVAKIVKNKDGEYDFAGHERKQRYEFNKQTGELEKKNYFDTQPIGNFTSCKLTEMDIDGTMKNVIIAEGYF